MILTLVLAKRISDRLRNYGHLMCTAEKVQRVAQGESLDDEPALESAILQELDEYGAAA